MAGTVVEARLWKNCKVKLVLFSLEENKDKTEIFYFGSCETKIQNIFRKFSAPKFIVLCATLNKLVLKCKRCGISFVLQKPLCIVYHRTLDTSYAGHNKSFCELFLQVFENSF